MGSLSLIIVLIIVVWVIVLAPMVMGNNKPIRRSGEGYDETRVLHAGGTAPVSGRRRPKLTPADVHNYGDDGDYEVVEAVDASEEDPVLADDTGGSTAVSLRGLFTRREAQGTDGAAGDSVNDTVEGEVVESGAVDVDAAADSAEADTDAAERAGDEVSGSTAYSVLVAERGDDAVERDGEAVEPYALDETYVSPGDLGYRDAGDDSPAQGRETPAVEEDASTDAAGSTAVAVSEEATGEPVNEELTAEEIEFARSRRGRGGWDPELEKASKADRFQRRQRTLLALIVADIVTFVVAFVAGGWTWLLPAVAIGLTAWFMTALRRVVQQERALQAHRVRQLRRARMGVISQESGAAATRFRRRPGAVIVEMDDESPDFEELPLYRAEPVAEAPRRGRDLRPAPRREMYRDYGAPARAS